MLSLVGIGLDVAEITLKGLESLTAADVVYYEEYTNPIAPEALEFLQKRTRIRFQRLARSDLEENSAEFVNEAKDKRVVLLVSGDPLSATTHWSLLADARAAGILTAVAHAPTILTSVSETGLQLYKFGRTVTLPRTETQSVTEAIIKNLDIGLHTLVLLDPGLEVKEACNILKHSLSSLVREAVVISRANTPKQAILFDYLENLDGELPASIIIPGSLHFTEEEALQQWR